MNPEDLFPGGFGEDSQLEDAFGPPIPTTNDDLGVPYLESDNLGDFQNVGQNHSAPGARTPEEAGISLPDATRIQNSANRTGQTITVVGSRAAGTSTLSSDWDYVMSGNSRQRHSAKRSLPRGTSGGEINSANKETGIDIFTEGVDPNLPHVTFTPQ
ncbi:MAG: hypothetical protein F6K00_02470 [Leptolyngbya sp. SIOISBB]|nr:hypothetical protein [Leptolyngbya sp. SIOISBB]